MLVLNNLYGKTNLHYSHQVGAVNSSMVYEGTVLQYVFNLCSIDFKADRYCQIKANNVITVRGSSVLVLKLTAAAVCLCTLPRLIEVHANHSLCVCLHSVLLHKTSM